MNVLFNFFIQKSLFLLMRNIIVITILILNSLGCIALTTVKYQDPELPKNPSTSQNFPKIVSIECACEFSVNGKLAEGNNKIRFSKNSLSGIERDFRDSGLFVIQNEGEDYQYKIKVVNKVQTNQNFGYNFIASISLLILPMINETKREILFVVTDPKGNQISRISRDGEQQLIAEWLLIFAMPFYWPFSDENNLFLRLNRSAIAEIYKDIEKYEKSLSPISVQ